MTGERTHKNEDDEIPLYTVIENNSFWRKKIHGFNLVWLEWLIFDDFLLQMYPVCLLVFF